MKRFEVKPGEVEKVEKSKRSSWVKFTAKLVDDRTLAAKSKQQRQQQWAGGRDLTTPREEGEDLWGSVFGSDDDEAPEASPDESILHSCC